MHHTFPRSDHCSAHTIKPEMCIWDTQTFPVLTFVAGEMVVRRMLGSKQGYVDSVSTDDIVNKKKHRRIRNSRSGCLAMIYLISDYWTSKTWRVGNFIQDRNHPLIGKPIKDEIPTGKPCYYSFIKGTVNNNVEVVGMLGIPDSFL